MSLTIECSLMGRCGLSPECVENVRKSTCVKFHGGLETQQLETQQLGVYGMSLMHA